MKQVLRYRRKKKSGGLLADDLAMALDIETLATRVSYAGSGEHTARPLDPSFDFSPALRSDASRCDPRITRERAQAALRQAVRQRCVSEDFLGDFPRYIWGWLDGQPHVARLDNQEQGAYKAWPIGTTAWCSRRRGPRACSTPRRWRSWRVMS